MRSDALFRSRAKSRLRLIDGPCDATRLSNTAAVISDLGAASPSFPTQELARIGRSVGNADGVDIASCIRSLDCKRVNGAHLRRIPTAVAAALRRTSGANCGYRRSLDFGFRTVAMAANPASGAHTPPWRIRGRCRCL